MWFCINAPPQLQLDFAMMFLPRPSPSPGLPAATEIQHFRQDHRRSQVASRKQGTLHRPGAGVPGFHKNLVRTFNSGNVPYGTFPAGLTLRFSRPFPFRFMF
jgi:hypothetical protein